MFYYPSFSISSFNSLGTQPKFITIPDSPFTKGAKTKYPYLPSLALVIKCLLGRIFP